MTKLEQAGFALADTLLVGQASSIPYSEVRSLICRAYTCGAKSNEKQESQPKKESISDAVLSVIAYLNEQTGRNFRCSAANASLIKARLSEHGVSIDGVLGMIKRQCDKWKGTDMEEYLRPSTLFRASKFDDYYSARHLPVNFSSPVKRKKRFGELCYGEE